MSTKKYIIHTSNAQKIIVKVSESANESATNATNEA